MTHGTTVEVVDIDAEKAVGRIEGMNGVHGVALAPKLGHGLFLSTFLVPRLGSDSKVKQS